MTFKHVFRFFCCLFISTRVFKSIPTEWIFCLYNSWCMFNIFLSRVASVKYESVEFCYHFSCKTTWTTRILPCKIILPKMTSSTRVTCVSNRTAKTVAGKQDTISVSVFCVNFRRTCLIYRVSSFQVLERDRKLRLHLRTRFRCRRLLSRYRRVRR